LLLFQNRGSDDKKWTMMQKLSQSMQILSGSEEQLSIFYGAFLGRLPSQLDEAYGEALAPFAAQSLNLCFNVLI